MRTLRVSMDHRDGEKGFTLIELLVVVTIIGILAAIVSVSVGGFTGKASVQAKKSTLTSVQAAVDAYVGDHFTGTGAQVAPTAGAAISATVPASAGWYGTDGQVLTAGFTVSVFTISNAQLTGTNVSTIANTTRTYGPYLRLGSNAITCVMTSTEFTVIACQDGAPTGQ